MNTTNTVASGYTMEIFVDHFPSNPRTEWENIGTMVCFHNRYRLGDKHDYNSNDFDSWDGLKKQIIKDHDPAVILPIYMYDHSGVTISTKPFSCPWDSGQIGFIFMSKQIAKKEYGFSRLTKQIKEKLTRYLMAEVKTYDQYLNGDVYGFEIKDPEGNVIQSVCGYYGREAAESEGKSELMYYNEKDSVSLQ
jgi:hypothetical protein